MLTHRGRVSGREYRNPVFATRSGSQLRLAVLYGTESDWVRNILAAGRRDVVRLGRPLSVADPQLVPTAGRADLGWLGRVAPHVVLARIVVGPGVRSFDPARLGTSEADAWVGYYRHEWRGVLTASVTLVAEGFGMGRRRTLLGAWYVLRANQKWAPYPATTLTRRASTCAGSTRWSKPTAAFDRPRRGRRARGRLVAHPPRPPACRVSSPRTT